MSWLNLNQSLNSLKGQITSLASEVLSEGPAHNEEDISINKGAFDELQEKCRNQELEITALKKLNDELQSSLDNEKITKKNGLHAGSSWNWQPQDESSAKEKDEEIHYAYKTQIQSLMAEISHLRDRLNTETRLDTEEEVVRLREENKNLTMNLEDLDNQHQMAMERLLTLKKELQKNFEILKQEHEELKTANDEYSAEIKLLRTQLHERDLASSASNVLQTKYDKLEKVHQMLKEAAEKFQEENQELHEEVFKLQEHVTKLEHELEMTVKHPELSDMVPRERYDDLLKEITDINQSRKQLGSSHLDESNIDDNAKSVIENLKRDINDLNHKLAKQNIDDKAFNPKYVKAEKLLQLYDQYVNFELPVDYIWNIASSGDNNLLTKIEGAFKTLHEFKKDIDSLEHGLAEKGMNEKRLQHQIDELSSDNDLLTNDVQTYYSQLTEMRKNNDFLISELTASKNMSKLEPIIETHEDNLVKLESELADSNKMNQSFQAEILKIVTELKEVRSEKKFLETTLNDLKEKFNTMLEEMEFYKIQAKRLDDLQSDTHSENLDRLFKVRQEIDELKNKLLGSESKNQKLSIDISVCENDKVILEKHLDDLKLTLHDKNAAYQELLLMNSVLEGNIKENENKILNVQQRKEHVENENTVLLNTINLLEMSNKRFDVRDNNENPTTPDKTLLHEAPKVPDCLNCDTSHISNEELLKELESLKEHEKELLIEIATLKHNNQVDNKRIIELEKTIKELESNVINQETLKNKISTLKSRNTELSKLNFSIDLKNEKITELEESIEKLSVDLMSRDAEVESLNAIITQNNTEEEKKDKNCKRLEENIVTAYSTIENLKKSVSDLDEKLKNANDQLKQNIEEHSSLINEKDAEDRKLYDLMQRIKDKDIELSNLKSTITELEDSFREHETMIGIKNAELKEMKQSLQEKNEKIKSLSSSRQNNEDWGLLTKKIEDKEEELTQAKVKIQELENMYGEHKMLLETATTEKTDLIGLVTLKHNESVQYHGEIQRLNQIILEQTNELMKVVSDNERLAQNRTDCLHCTKYLNTLKGKDEIIEVLNKTVSDYEIIKRDLTHSRDTIKTLTDKAQQLEDSLTMKVDELNQIREEKAQLSEKDQNSTRELERLRYHLMETEENYTQELMVSEQKLTDCQTRLHKVEDRAKQTSTVYTSNSIRANQEVETLRNQLKLLERQRDDVQSKLSEAEDSYNKSEAALTNLQIVLEQFLQDKDRDINIATEKLQNKMASLMQQNGALHLEIDRLNVKLNDSLAGLQAATRLGDQLETKTAHINDLKEQVRTLQMSVQAAEERYYSAISNQQDKVDKNLVKNLLLNYVQTTKQNVGNRTQALRILSTVLDFNQSECERLGLARGQASTTEGLAREFVRFLEQESRPVIPLPTMMGLTSVSRATTPTAAANTTAQLTERMGHSRNTSSGSQNLLLQNIESVETSSQLSVDSGSASSEHKPIAIASPVLDSGVNQIRNTEGAILKQVLKDIS